MEEPPDQRRESGAEVRRMAQDISEQSKELATEYYQQGREKVLEWERQLVAQVRDKPLQSLLIAGGIGLLLGLLRQR